MLAILAGNKPTLASRYHALAEHYDSNYYARIIKEGYSAPKAITDNTLQKYNFFPGYPLLAGVVKVMTRMDAQYALALTAQLACWGLWVYIFLILRSWRVSRMTGVFCVGAIFTYCSSFFLVNGYSESLFLCMVTGYFYWMACTEKPHWLFASVHGFILTATRIVGLPLALLPLLIAVARRRDARPTQSVVAYWGQAFLTSVITVMGSGLFFLYSQLYLGRWDKYSATLSQPQYLRTRWIGFRFEIYQFFVPTTQHLSWFIIELNRLVVPFIALGIAIILLMECLWGRRTLRQFWKFRFPLYYAGALFFFINLTAMASPTEAKVYFLSMIRHSLETVVVFLLGCTHLLSTLPSFPQWLKYFCFAVVFSAFLSSLLLQEFLQMLFLKELNVF